MQAMHAVDNKSTVKVDTILNRFTRNDKLGNSRLSILAILVDGQTL